MFELAGRPFHKGGCRARFPLLEGAEFQPDCRSGERRSLIWPAGRFVVKDLPRSTVHRGRRGAAVTQNSPSENPAPDAGHGGGLYLRVAQGKVAVVDDDEFTRRLLRGWLETAGYEVVEFGAGAEALAAGPLDLIAACVDLGLGDASGIAVMKQLQGRDGDLPVIVITANRELEVAVEAMRAGACDYVTKPLDAARTLAALDHAVQQRALRAQLRAAEHDNPEIACVFGGGAEGRELAERIDAAAASDGPVWIVGERGSGKSAIAKLIHSKSRRGGKRFTRHVVGAHADSGELQRENGPDNEEPGGSIAIKRPESVDSEEREDLAELARKNGTSPRLFFLSEENPTTAWPNISWRDLTVVTIPALRERRADIPYLARHFLQRLDSPGPTRVRAEAVDILMSYEWPGNVREFEVVLQTAALACEGAEIRADDLPGAVKRDNAGIQEADSSVVPLKELERQAIEQALRVTGGSVTRAAKMLGMGRATLYRRLAHLGIAPDSSPRSN
jgi:DNA-binding NtrC family response regulator